MVLSISEEIRERLRRAVWLYRSATRKKRSLPDFIVIGAQKSGTSSLFYYLSQHPQLVHPFRAEIHYFDGGLNPKVDNYQKGEAWYRTYFPLESKLRGGGKTYEVSPLYIFHPFCPERIHALLPGVRLIALLRNPVERAISHYHKNLRNGVENRPIMDAMKEEDEFIAKIHEMQDYKSKAFRYYSYKSRGIYVDQLRKYLDYFPQEQMFILNSEEFFSSPSDSLSKLFDFVGIDKDFKPADLNPVNVGTNRKKVDDEVFEYLKDYFAQYNEELYQLIGKRFDW